MITRIAWANLFHSRLRAVAAIGGVSLAIVLIFFQLGIYTAMQRASTMMLEQLDFDIALVSPQYRNVLQTGDINRKRLVQARGVQPVLEAIGFYAFVPLWRNEDDGRRREVFLMGVDPSVRLFRDDRVNALLPLLNEADTALFDRRIGPGYGPVDVGVTGEINRRRLKLVGSWSHGGGVIANAFMLVSEQTFRNIVSTSSLDHPSMGLVRLQPGADATRAAGALQRSLGPDVRVLTRAQLLAGDEHFFMRMKPVGVMFTSGILIAFVIGLVIVYQVLAAEILRHLREYATLKAIGYTAAHLRSMVAQQAVIFALLGFVPALAAAAIMHTAIANLTLLPMKLTPASIMLVAAMTMGMCIASAVATMRKLDRADPAELF